MINSWLDGEAPEPAALNAESARQIDLWRRIEEESERRRHMVTPAHVKAQIMAALPADAPQMALPWWKKSIQVSPVVALAAAAGLANLKGHRSVGGMRASLYNAMPEAGVDALIEFMRDFERRYG